MDTLYPDEYGGCFTCGAGPGLPCLNLRSVRRVSYISRPHRDRPSIAPEVSMEACRVRIRVIDAKTLNLGHDLTWSLGDRATRRDYEYYWEGRCDVCQSGVYVMVDRVSFFGVMEVSREACRGVNVPDPSEEWLTWLQGPKPVGL